MAVEPLAPGRRLGKYEIVSHLANGGMGAVYRAREDGSDRIVALKVLLPELSERPNLLERFRREAKHASKLTHRHIVNVLDFGEDNGQYYLAMEFIEGMDLDELIVRRGKLTPEESVGIMIQAVKALDHAFRLGVVHRDIKPSNFLITRGEKGFVVKLLDFGLARAESDDEFRVTRAGSTVGTIDYLSPEQARDSGTADVRSDIYSLGCTLYHMLAGHPPFPEGGLGERIYHHMNTEPPDVRALNSATSDDLWAVLQKMLAKKPGDRYQTPGELMHDLTRLRNGEPLRRGIGDLTGLPTGGIDPFARPRGTTTVRDETPAELPAAAEPGGSKQRKVIDDDPRSLGLSEADRKEAAVRFEKSKAAFTAGRLEETAQLMLSAVKLDPTVLNYRRALRKLNKPKKEGWLASLSNLAAHGKLMALKAAGDDRKLLVTGEELLMRGQQPTNVHVEMVEAALRLKLKQTALWMAEKARDADPDNPALVRLLAKTYELAHHYQQAILMWRVLERLDPDDREAGRKITHLAASLSISRSRPSSSEG
jgi:serine/threonine protein kinase